MSTPRTASARLRAPQRVTGGLRKPSLVRAADYDELTIELSALRHEAIDAADYLEPRIEWMVPVAVELGPSVYQTVIGCLHRIGRLRKRATA
jgi:hypothetical protein